MSKYLNAVQCELVDASRRLSARRRRAWRRRGACITALIVLATPPALAATHAIQPSLRIHASASEVLARSFGVFRRERTPTDAMTFDPRGSNPYLSDLHVDESRLVADTNSGRVWLVPEGSDTVCMVLRGPSFGGLVCARADSAANPATPLSDYIGTETITLVPDGVTTTTIRSADGTNVSSTASNNITVTTASAPPLSMQLQSEKGSVNAHLPAQAIKKPSPGIIATAVATPTPAR